MSEPLLRPGRPEDAEAIAGVLARAFDAYRVFGPPGWVPPERGTPEDVARVRDALADPAVWAEVAEAGGVVVGMSSFLAGPEPALAHLRWCFVDPPWWGTGVARRLLADAMTAAAGAGYARMRLFTPAGQARARRFYVREGFAEAGPPAPDARFGQEIVLLVRALPPAGS